MLLELVHVSKVFGSTRALSDVSFDVRPGEVHVLAGGNGAGKSTLIKILSGAITDFQGDLRVEGTAVRFHAPQAAVRAGVATLHQELSLIPGLSVLDNLLLGERRSLASAWRGGAHVAECRTLLERVGLGIDPRRPVETLGLSERQLVEVARALRRAASVLVLDEPTSSLAEPEAERLFQLIAELRAQGKGVVFISHRLDEIFRVADRISVLRDGRVVFSGPASELDEASLVEKMAGRPLDVSNAASSPESAGVTLAVSRLGSRPELDDVSFELRTGEIVGVAGLQDSGSSALLRALCGASPHQGEITLGGRRFSPDTPRAALAQGVCHLARYRSESVFPARSITENVTLSSLGRLFPTGLLGARRERALAARATEPLALVASSLAAPAGVLSGGNQQKVALARCLLAEPKLLLLDDPTRGIDVAAKADVHRLVRAAAKRGTSVLVASSDFDELLALCDRIVVLFRGRRRAVLSRDAFDRERLLALAMGAEAA
ncbi:MAG: sugar ABC transporter ATP-binding protein [Polyangiaceae bacterium]|nr:sugar ABC transporter ATP-binding protein [Polyangiaceae bacterium]